MNTLPKKIKTLSLALLLCAQTSLGLEFTLLSNDDDSFHDITLPLGTPSLISTSTIPGDFVELIEASPLRIYTFDRQSNSILAINRFDGSVISKTALDQILVTNRRGFDIAPDGTIYGIFHGMKLRTIDPGTGECTLVATIAGAGSVESIAFSDNGKLYATGSVVDNSSSEILYELSLTDGTLTTIGEMNTSDVDCLTFAPDGNLYGLDSSDNQDAHLLQIDPATATVTDLGPTGVTGVTGIVVTRQFVSLTATGDNQSIQLRWPTEIEGFSIQNFWIEETQILNSTTWNPLNIDPQIDGDDFFIDLPIQHPLQFFRLAR